MIGIWYVCQLTKINDHRNWAGCDYPYSAKIGENGEGDGSRGHGERNWERGGERGQGQGRRGLHKGCILEYLLISLY